MFQRSALPPSYKHGKTAGMIHGLSVLSLVATAVCCLTLRHPSKEYPVTLAVGGTSTLVYGVWSLVLAYRALKNSEKPGWPLAICLMILFEASLFMQTLWIFSYTSWAVRCVEPLYWVLDFSFKSALPVFLPCLFVVSCIAWPVAAWRVRRAERLAIAAGGQPWTRSRRCKRGLAWYGVVAFVLSLLILPAPLFLFCALTTCERGSGVLENDPPKKNFRSIVAQNIPDFIRDGMDTILNWLDYDPWTERKYYILSMGYVSKVRLIKHVNGLDTGLFFASWYALATYHPADALPFALNICGDKEPPAWKQNGWPHQIIYLASSVINKLADEKAIQQCLENAAGSPEPFDTIKIYNIYKANPKKVREALFALAKPKTAKRAQFLEWLVVIYCDGGPEEQKFLMNLLDDADITFRRELFAAITRCPCIIYAPCAPAEPWKIILKALGNSDLVLRRSAARDLFYSSYFKLELSAPLQPPESPAKPGEDVYAGAPPLPEQPGEAQAFEQIRAAAEKWLADHKPTPQPFP